MTTKTVKRRFSMRLKKPGVLIFDDAPASLRLGYVALVLPGFVEPAYRSYNSAPLEVDSIHQLFLARARIDAEPHMWGESSSWDALTSHLKLCDWAQFFDFVELVAELLIDADDRIPHDSDAKFSCYRDALNDLLDEESIGWRMDGAGELKRKVPALRRAIESADGALDKRFSIARQHYKRALQYLLTHPVDEGNSIKEIVSALESVAKVLAPKASTLGAAVAELRKDSRFNRWALDIAEKVYAYSNASPFVRHGQTSGQAPTRAEAEMIVQSGLALICYLVESADTDRNSL